LAERTGRTPGDEPLMIDSDDSVGPYPDKEEEEEQVTQPDALTEALTRVNQAIAAAEQYQLEQQKLATQGSATQRTAASPPTGRPTPTKKASTNDVESAGKLRQMRGRIIDKVKGSLGKGKRGKAVELSVAL